MTQLRKLHKELFPKKLHEIIDKIFSVDEARVEKRRALAAEALRTQLTHKLLIPKKDILKFVELANTSEDWLDHISLVMLATGRRFIEVLKVTPLPKQIPSKVYGPNTIGIDNIAKRNPNVEFKPFKAPVMFIKYKRLSELWKNIREKLGDDLKLSNSELTSKYSGLVLNRIRKLFKHSESYNAYRLVSRPGTHILRKIYIKSVVKKFKKKETDSMILMHKLLGHSSKGLGSTANYKNVVITGWDEKYVRETPKELKKAVEVLKQHPTNEQMKILTFDRMVRIVTELVEEGINPTYSVVRTRGKFGSKAIGKYLNIVKQIVSGLQKNKLAKENAQKEKKEKE